MTLDGYEGLGDFGAPGDPWVTAYIQEFGSNPWEDAAAGYGSDVNAWWGNFANPGGPLAPVGNVEAGNPAANLLSGSWNALAGQMAAANDIAALQMKQAAAQAAAHLQYLHHQLQVNQQNQVYASRVGDAQFLDTLHDQREAIERQMDQSERTLEATSTGWYRRPSFAMQNRKWPAPAPRPAGPGGAATMGAPTTPTVMRPGGGRGGAAAALFEPGMTIPGRFEAVTPAGMERVQTGIRDATARAEAGGYIGRKIPGSEDARGYLAVNAQGGVSYHYNDLPGLVPGITYDPTTSSFGGRYNSMDLQNAVHGNPYRPEGYDLAAIFGDTAPSVPEGYIQDPNDPGWAYDPAGAFDAAGNPTDWVELGQGGIARRPTRAIIGERGPEAVIPLNQRGLMFALSAMRGRR